MSLAEDAEAEFVHIECADGIESAGPQEEEDKEEEQEEEAAAVSLKDALTDAWSSLKFSLKWSRREKFSRRRQPQAACVLGLQYDLRSQRQQLLDDLGGRFYFCYRKHFRPLRHSSGRRAYSTDAGWGCVYRCAQMLAANALQILHFGRRAPLPQFAATHAYRQLCRLFLSADAPLSLAGLLRASGGQPGEWTGPASACELLAAILRDFGLREPLLAPLSALVARHCCVSRDQVLASLAPNQFGECRSLLLLAPLWLGDRRESVLPLLGDQTCLGLIGGKPRRSMYFVGYHGDRLIGFDPHHCVQECEDARQLHGARPLTLQLRQLDPSCALAFLLRNRQEAAAFLHRLQLLTDLLCVVTDQQLLLATAHSATVSETAGRAESVVSLGSRCDEYVLL